MRHSREFDEEFRPDEICDLHELIEQHLRVVISDPMEELQSAEEALYQQWSRARAAAAHSRRLVH